MAKPYTYSQLANEETGGSVQNHDLDQEEKVSSGRTVVETSLASRLRQTDIRKVFLSTIVVLLAYFAGFASHLVYSRIPSSTVATHHKVVRFELTHEYSGPPSEQTNALWNDLLPGNGWVRIPKSGRTYKSPLEYNEIYNLAVFHQLHCLNGLRTTYWNSVNSSSTPENATYHASHCFEYLRQSILCSADASLEPYDDESQVTLTWGVDHQCRDVDQLRLWAGERKIMDRKNIEKS